MSVSVKVVSGDLQKITDEVSRLHGAIEGEKIRSEMGFAMMQTIRDHFAKIAQDGQHHQSANSLGATRTGFYERARQNTQPPQVVSGGVMVAITLLGFAQRYFGGEIHAVNSKFLTIPALAIAYGHRAREFDLRFIIFKDTGLAALVAKGTPEHEGSVYYWLVRSVTQQADPSVLPTEDEIVTAAKKSAGEYLDLVWGAK